MRAHTVTITLMAVCAFLFAGCNGVPVDKAAFAAEAGLRTALVGTSLGSCGLSDIGWKVCQMEDPATLPKLQIFFMNPGNYAVSDCDAGVLKTDSVAAAGMVEVDLSPLLETVRRRDFCFLQVEAEERWQDDRGNQRRYPVLGGFLIQTFERGYLPTPAREDVAFCYKVYRTTSGRTAMERCP